MMPHEIELEEKHLNKIGKKSSIDISYYILNDFTQIDYSIGIRSFLVDSVQTFIIKPLSVNQKTFSVAVKLFSLITATRVLTANESASFPLNIRENYR